MSRPIFNHIVSSSFTTTFPNTENPLSESGHWLKAANSWQAVRSVSGIAKPAAYTESFDDCYSLCQVISPTNAEVIATVFRQNATAAEYEILLRMSDTPGSPGTTSGYECLCDTTGSVQIMRWNGPLGDFTDITGTTNNPGSLADGNQLRATIIGSALTFYHRPNSGASWTQIGVSNGDSTYLTGKCGIAFYVHAAGGNIDDVGYHDLTINPL